MLLGIIAVAILLYIILKPKNNATTTGQNTNINRQAVNTMNNQNLQNSQYKQEIPVAPAPDPEPIVLSFDDKESSKQNENSDVAPSPRKNATFERLSFCPYCGKKLDEEFTFCPFCGKALK